LFGVFVRFFAASILEAHDTLLQMKRLKEIWVLNKNNKHELYIKPKEIVRFKNSIISVFNFIGYNSYNIFTNKSISYLGIISNGLLAIDDFTD
jgi:hypothetical protein